LPLIDQRASWNQSMHMKMGPQELIPGKYLSKSNLIF
jgi:hypothetical protein